MGSAYASSMGELAYASWMAYDMNGLWQFNGEKKSWQGRPQGFLVGRGKNWIFYIQIFTSWTWAYLYQNIEGEGGCQI